MIHSGDMVDRHNSEREWGEWFEAGGWILAMIPSIPVAGTDLVNAVAADSQALLELVGVATVEDRKGVNTRAPSTHLIGEMRAELHLADAGGVALGQDRGVRRDVLDRGRHQPQMVRVNHVGSEVREKRPQVIGPCTPVYPHLVVCECRETGARVGHDVTHPGHCEIERRSTECERIDLIWVQATDRGPRVIDRHTDDHPLLVAGIGGMPDHRLEGDAAAGQ